MSENKKPRLAEILGVKVEQEFRIEGYSPVYRVSACGNLHFNYSPTTAAPWRKETSSTSALIAAINHPETVRPVTQWTQDDIEDAKAVRRLYPEYEWVARDNGIRMQHTSLFAYNGKPERESDYFSVGICGKANGYLPIPLTALPSVTWENSPVRIADILGDGE